jgi:hypothetical protein
LVVEKVAAPPEDSDVIQMPIFEVSSDNDKGYLATSAMSGTRLNSKIEDLAASLSVVTKQQLMDTASVDINDVFMYEANTEGTAQWTSFANDRGTISDDIQANPTTATRMRGLSSANTAVGGFASTLPFDTYNIESVEISRGPNSTVFGLGNTGGGVNINAARANLTRAISSFGTRGDSYGGYRGNFDINRPILKDHVAIRLMGLYDEKGFERKPSSESIRRLEAALTVRPFKNTTFRGSFESYRDYFNRPNSMTPRDGISDWIASGKPTYDPITQTVHFANGKSLHRPDHHGQRSRPVARHNRPQRHGLHHVPQLVHRQRPDPALRNQRHARGDRHGPHQRQRRGPPFAPKPDLLREILHPVSALCNAGYHNKSLYDWTSVNISAPNYGKTKGETSNLDFEQIFLNTPRQTLALQASWMGERTGTDNRSFLGSYGNAGGKLQVYVDINEKLLDGSPNPYFLRPYLGYPRPQYTKSSSNTDDYRSTLAYELNLTNEKGWLKYLGRHRFSGYGEYRSTYSAKPGLQRYPVFRRGLDFRHRCFRQPQQRRLPALHALLCRRRQRLQRRLRTQGHRGAPVQHHAPLLQWRHRSSGSTNPSITPNTISPTGPIAGCWARTAAPGRASSSTIASSRPSASARTSTAPATPTAPSPRRPPPMAFTTVPSPPAWGAYDWVQVGARPRPRASS